METAALGKYLDVFVQPGEWSGDENDKPMKQLRVVAEHKLDDATASPDAALMSTTQECRSHPSFLEYFVDFVFSGM